MGDVPLSKAESNKPQGNENLPYEMHQMRRATAAIIENLGVCALLLLMCLHINKIEGSYFTCIGVGLLWSLYVKKQP